MCIYSNDNIRKIVKLTTRELPQKSKNAEITVRENNGLYSKWINALIINEWLYVFWFNALFATWNWKDLISVFNCLAFSLNV